MQESNKLSEQAEKEFCKIAKNTICQIIICADKHNLNRDNCIEYFTGIFNFISNTGTFKEFEIKED